MSLLIESFKLNTVITKAFLGAKELEKALEKQHRYQKQTLEMEKAGLITGLSQDDLEKKLAKEVSFLRKRQIKNQKRAQALALVLTEFIKENISDSNLPPSVAKAVSILAQLLFFWDETIDLKEIFQAGEKADLQKVKESAFYKTAIEILKKLSEKDFQKLSKGRKEIDTEINTEKVRRLLRNISRHQLLEAPNYFEILVVLKKAGIVTWKAVISLLDLEAEIFVSLAINLWQKSKDKLAWQSINKASEKAISKFLTDHFAYIKESLEKLVEQTSYTVLNPEPILHDGQKCFPS